MPTQPFNSRVYVPEGIVTNRQGEILDLRELSPFLRTLLVTDGTVTKSLEAFFWEPIKVITQVQKRLELEEPCPLLNVAEGADVIQREVCLQGSASNNVYVYASSVILTAALSEQQIQLMLEGAIGIGELLRELGLETYREIVDFGESAALDVPSGSIYRTYLIHIAGQSAMQITEHFPRHLYSD